MTLAARFVTTLAFCVVTIQWFQTSARFIGHASSSAPLAEFFHKDNVEMIGLRPADDSSAEQRHARRLPVGTSIFNDDYEDTVADRTSSSLQRLRSTTNNIKRSPWAPSEVRVDQLMQRLRSQLYQNRYKHSSPSISPIGDVIRRRRSGLPSIAPSSVADLEQLRRLLQATPSEHRPHEVIDDLETDIALLEFLKATEHPMSRPDIAALRSAAARPETANDVDDGIDSVDGEWSNVDDIETIRDEGAAEKRAAFVGAAEIRSPRDIHPVYLGMGQSAASAALNTYASLLADDKRRESSELHLSSNPVRFIGKR